MVYVDDVALRLDQKSTAIITSSLSGLSSSYTPTPTRAVTPTSTLMPTTYWVIGNQCSGSPADHWTQRR